MELAMAQGVGVVSDRACNPSPTTRSGAPDTHADRMTHPAGQDASCCAEAPGDSGRPSRSLRASGRLKRKTVGEVQAKSPAHHETKVRKLGCTPSLEAPEAPKKCTHGRFTVPVALSEGALPPLRRTEFAFPASVDLERGATFETDATIQRMVSA